MQTPSRLSAKMCRPSGARKYLNLPTHRLRGGLKKIAPPALWSTCALNTCLEPPFVTATLFYSHPLNRENSLVRHGRGRILGVLRLYLALPLRGRSVPLRMAQVKGMESAQMNLLSTS